MAQGHDDNNPGREQLPPEEAAQRAEEIYERSIRARIERDHDGDFVVINIATGEFEVDSDILKATDRARSRFGNAPLFTLRVGREETFRLGGHIKARRAC